MTPDALSIPAYAKINLSLEVLGKRSDGYHEVATVLQTVALADEVVIEDSERLEVDCDDEGLSGESNIVWDAAQALSEHVGIEPRARITIRKRIPVAAGLGGGSADAAAALRGLNRLWGLALTAADLRRVARRLGTDVVFQLTGGAALGTGRGDELAPLAGRESVHLLIVAPQYSIPGKTPMMYGALAPTDYTDGESTRSLFESEAWVRGNIDSGGCRNAFTRAALEIFPGLWDVWEKAARVTSCRPCLSGAGPAFFCMPSNEAEAAMVRTVLANTGATVFQTRTIYPAYDV